MTATRRLYEFACKLIREKIYCLSGNDSVEHDCEDFTSPENGTCDLCAMIAEASKVLGEDCLG